MAPSRGTGQHQLAGTNRRTGDAAHRRERASPFPAFDSGNVRARHRARRICNLSRRGHPDRRGRHYRDTCRPEVGGSRRIGRGRDRRVAHRRSRPAGSTPASDPRTSERSRPARSSMFDAIRAAPGISPTSPASGTATTVSAFGSGTNENQFLIDGTNDTCPCNGVARAEPGVDFIQEVQVQSVGASAEFGNMQGAVFNVITRQGSDRFLYDASYYGQTAGLTSQPVRLPLHGAGDGQSGYERVRYRDFTTNLGGPVVRDRLWFFAGISTCATTTVNRAPTRRSREPTSRTRSSRSSPGSSLRPGSLMQSLHQRVLGQPRSADARDAVRSHRSAAAHRCRP